MKKFKIGSKYNLGCWFTGGEHSYTCIDRTDNTVTFFVKYNESDGICQIGSEIFDINIDDLGEYVVIQTYKGTENRMYGEEKDVSFEYVNEINQKRENLIRYGTILSDLTIGKVNVRIRIFLLDGIHWYLHEHNGKVVEIYRLGIDEFMQRNMYRD